MEEVVLVPSHVLQGSWKDSEVLEGLLSDIETSLSIQDPSDWYRVSEKILALHGGLYLVKKNGGLYKVEPR